MNITHDHSNPPPPATDAWLDDLLAADAATTRATYIDDAGFTAGVVASLPSTAALPAWRKPMVATLWGVAAVALALALPSLLVDLLREAHRLFSTQPFSLASVGIGIAAMVALTLGAAAWSLDDRG